VAAALAGALGCAPHEAVCPQDLRARLSPEPPVAVAVGASFDARAEYLGCGGARRLEDVVTWTSRDTLVARVDARTGRVTGAGPGATVVEARGAKYQIAVPLPVTVYAP
jgi:hypothetical protein